MNILIITGELKLHSCGVCDYTANLYKQLSKMNKYNIDLLSYKKIKIQNIKNADIILMNYPCPEYGFSLLPHLKFIIGRIIFNKKMIYIMHEYSYVNSLRKLSIKTLLYISSKSVSVTKEELDNFPDFLKKKSVHIPIVSNINGDQIEVEKESDFVISYFGTFYPAKKIENIIQAISDLKKRGIIVKLRLIGAKHPNHDNYLNFLKEQIINKDIENITEFYLNQPEETVVKLLKQSHMCVLFFEEGVTMRRGSFLTALELGLIVVTNKGIDTPSFLNNHKGIIFSNKEELAKELENVLPKWSQFLYDPKIENQKIDINNWNNIVLQYQSIFD